MATEPQTQDARVYDLDKPSVDAAAMSDFWLSVQDFLTGLDAVKLASARYLPKFDNETKSSYDLRKSVASLTNVFSDIVENLASKPFAAPVTLDDKTNPQPLKDFAENVDGSGTNITAFAADMFFNSVANGIDWIFVDYPDAPKPEGRERTQAEESQLGLRPFWTHVRALNMLEVRTETLNGNEVLSYVRILEPENGVRYVRIIQRFGDVVTWEVWKPVGLAGTGKQSRTEYARDRSGTMTIDEIPLYPHLTGRRIGRTWQLHPPMRSSLDLQKKLYRNETALEYTKLLTAYPMLAGQGVKPDTTPDGKAKPIAIGPGVVVYAPPNGQGVSGSWSFIEPGAQSLTFLAAQNADTIKELRELGRQPLTAQSGNLTVITTAVAAQKGNSACQAWAGSGGLALGNAMGATAKWLGVPLKEKPKVTLFTDFDVDGSGVEELTALGKMRTDGDLSQDSLWVEMKRRNVLSPEFDADKEKVALLAEYPGDPATTEDGGDPANPPIPPDNQPRLPGV